MLRRAVEGAGDVLREVVVRGGAVADCEGVPVRERVVVSRADTSRVVRGAGYGALTPSRLSLRAAAFAMNSRVSPAG